MAIALFNAAFLLGSMAIDWGSRYRLKHPHPETEPGAV